MSLPKTLQDQIKIRPPNQSDTSFILNSWLKSYRNSVTTRVWSNEVYYKAQTKLIQELLALVPVHVLCDSLDESHIYGYVCGEMGTGQFVVHYAYMKLPYRRLGLIKSLVNVLSEGRPVATTHWMPVCRHLRWKKMVIK